MSLKRRLWGNLGANVYGQVVITLIHLTHVPLFLHFWGKERYGEWLALYAVPAFLSLADFGLGTAGANRMTMLTGRGETGRARAVLHTMWGLLLPATALAAAAAAGIARACPWERWLGFQITPAAEARAALCWLSWMTLLNLHGTVLVAIYRAKLRNARGTALLNSARLFQLAVIALALPWTRSPALLAGLLFAAQACCLAIMGLDAWRVSPGLRLGLTGFSRREARALWRPALAYMAFPLGNSLYFQGLTLAVNAVLGAGAVVVFNTARALTRLLSQSATVLKHTLWPEFSYLMGAEDLNRARRLHDLGLELSFALMGGLSALLFITGPPLIQLWTGGRVILDRLTLSPFIAAAAVNGLWFVPGALVQATNRHAGLAARYALSSGTGILAALALCPSLGPAGGAAGMLLPEIFLFGYVLPVCCRMLERRPAELARQTLSFPAFRGFLCDVFILFKTKAKRKTPAHRRWQET